MKQGRTRAMVVAACVLCAVVTAGSAGPAAAAGRSHVGSVQLVGAGSTFDAPFFQRAFAAYEVRNPVSITYHAVGSGAGIKQFSSAKVDFGASDVPMNGTELALAVIQGGGVVQVPITLGGVAISYNLPGVPRKLRIDGPTLAEIFLGKIHRWNDPALTALNPGQSFPAIPIVPVHRSDSSGTTYITTDYLSAVSAAWVSKVGKGKLLTWPTGIAGNGNGGVAAAIKSTPGAFGYLELSVALKAKLPFMAIRNKANAFVLPSTDSIIEDALRFPVVTAQQFSIVNADGPASYPISGYSWVLLRQHPTAHEAALVKLFEWMSTTGQQYAEQVSYVPLPAQVQRLALQMLSNVS